MKKYWYFTGLLVVAMLLSACGGAAATAGVQSGAAAQSDSTPAPASQPTNGQFEMPISLKLALGTLNLDGTSNEVSPAEATALLPLWKAVRSLGSSDTVAAEEMNALYNQIQETMSTDQIDAIDAMQLTGASMSEIAQKLGIELFGNGGGGRLGTFTPEMQATAQAARESGQFQRGDFPVPPQGGFPGGGPGGGGGFGGEFQGGSNLTPEQQATMTARRATNGNRVNVGVPTALLDALIQYLEGKIG